MELPKAQNPRQKPPAQKTAGRYETKIGVPRFS
jgi:hypothetical protein